MSLTNPNDVLAAVGLKPEEGKVWLESWPLSEKSFVPENLFFLKDDYVSEACRTLKMDDEARRAFLEALPAFKNSQALQRLAWHCHYLLFQRRDAQHTEKISSWPMLPGVGMFYAFIFLSGLNHARNIHQKLGIPEAITLDTLSDLQLWIYEYRKKNGIWGFAEKGWLAHHFLGKLFKLGRLQFLPGNFAHDFHVFRHSTGKHLILAGENMCFRRDGQFDGADKTSDAEGKWTAGFEVKDDHISGHPVSPHGKALPERIKLPASEWLEILKKKSPALTIHIPATGPLLHSDCGASLQQAVEFFPRYFPEYGFNALTCESWLLDGQFESHISPSSNIVRFLREFYLYPLPNADDKQTFERVFGRNIEDIKNAPQDTSLQRAVVKHVSNGGRWRMGGGMLFPDGMKWGGQVYRNE